METAIKYAKRYKLLIIIGLLFGVASVVLNTLISLEDINTFSQRIQEYQADMPRMTMFIFAALYILSVALSLPIASFFTLAAGAVFGTGLGSALVIFSATVGSIPPFLLVKYKFSEAILKKYPMIAPKLKEELDASNGLFLFSARLTPILPFYLINVLSGLSKISVLRYALISAAGIAPGTIAYVFAGSQLEKAIETGTLVSVEVLLGIGALSIISFTNAFIKRRKNKKDLSGSDDDDMPKNVAIANN